MTGRVVRIGDCVLHLGDCRDHLADLGRVDVCIADQPYGSGFVRGGASVGVFLGTGARPAWDVWSTDWIDLVDAGTVAAFCPCSRLSDLIAALGGGQLRFYVKSNPRPALRGVDAPSVEPIVVYPRVRFGIGPQHFTAYNGDNEFHETQKPLPVMEWLVLGCSAPGETILDPFCGSGTTGVAAVRMGRSFIGIERDPVHFATACRRIEEAHRQRDLFHHVPAAAPAVTPDLFAGAA